MSLIILPIMALIFTILPDKIFKEDVKIVGMTLVIAEDDVAANASKTIYGISCISEKTAEIEIPCKIHNSKHIEAFCEVCWHPVCI